MSKFSYLSCPNPKEQHYKSFVDIFRERTESTPDKEIFIHRLPDGGRKALTYKELSDKATKLAKYLVSKGISVGDSFAIMGANSLEWVIGEVAIFMTGAVAVQCQGSCEEFNETVLLLKSTQCKAILLDPNNDPRYLSEMSKFFQEKETQIRDPETPRVVLLSKPVGVDLPFIGDILSEEEDSKVLLPVVQPESSAVIFTTSGSSGIPKMVEFTHFALTNSPIGNFFTTENDITFSDRPFTWLGGTPIYSLAGGYARVFTDPKIILQEEKIQTVWEILKEEKCTVATLFPYALKDMLDNAEEILATGYKPTSIATGGQIPGSHLNAIAGKFCERIYSVYGSTEVGLATRVFLTAETEVGNVGNMVPGYEVKIIGDGNTTLERGQIGDIVLRSPWMLKGYRNSPEMNKDSFLEGGWFRTSDIGIITEDGKFFMKGKSADVIRRGTKKIMYSAVEIAMNNFPGVKEVVVVALPDARLLEEVCACVIFEDDVSIPEHELRKLCLDKLGDNVTGDSPTFYLTFKTFPRLGNGKIDRITIKKEAMEILKLC